MSEQKWALSIFVRKKPQKIETDSRIASCLGYSTGMWEARINPAEQGFEHRSSVSLVSALNYWAISYTGMGLSFFSF